MSEVWFLDCRGTKRCMMHRCPAESIESEMSNPVTMSTSIKDLLCTTTFGSEKLNASVKDIRLPAFTSTGGSAHSRYDKPRCPVMQPVVESIGRIRLFARKPPPCLLFRVPRPRTREFKQHIAQLTCRVRRWYRSPNNPGSALVVVYLF